MPNPTSGFLTNALRKWGRGDNAVAGMLAQWLVGYDENDAVSPWAPKVSGTGPTGASPYGAPLIINDQNILDQLEGMREEISDLRDILKSIAE